MRLTAAAYLIAETSVSADRLLLSSATTRRPSAPSPSTETRSRVAPPAGREPVELEGDDLDGRSEDGGVRQHPLLQIGALLQARLFQRDHLRRHRDGSSDGEEHFFRHFSVQARTNGCFYAGTESHTKTQRNNKTRGQTHAGDAGRRGRSAPMWRRTRPSTGRRDDATRTRNYVAESAELPPKSQELCKWCAARRPLQRWPGGRPAPPGGRLRSALPARRAATGARARRRAPGRAAVARRAAGR